MELRATYSSESLIDNIGVLEMVIGKEQELVEKIPNIDAAQGIHLREWKHTWEPAARLIKGRWPGVGGHVREFLHGLLLVVPTDVEHLFVFLERVDRHGHVIIRRNDLALQSVSGNGCARRPQTNLLEIFTEAPLQKLGILGEQGKLEVVECSDGVPPSLPTSERLIG